MKETMDGGSGRAVGGDWSQGKASGLWAKSQHSWEKILPPLLGCHQEEPSGLLVQKGTGELTTLDHRGASHLALQGQQVRICVRTPQPRFLAG